MLARATKLMTDIAVTKMDGGGGKKTAERNGIDIGIGRCGLLDRVLTFVRKL